MVVFDNCLCFSQHLAVAFLLIVCVFFCILFIVSYRVSVSENSWRTAFLGIGVACDFSRAPLLLRIQTIVLLTVKTGRRVGTMNDTCIESSVRLMEKLGEG